MLPNRINEIIKESQIKDITDFHRSGDLVYSFSNLSISSLIFKIYLLEIE